MDYTTNLNLGKPLENEFYDVNVFNSNADIIDAAVAAKADSIDLTTKADKSTIGDTSALAGYSDLVTAVLAALNKSNIKKNPDATDGDIIDTHLTIGTRVSGVDVGENSLAHGTNNGITAKSSAIVASDNSHIYNESSSSYVYNSAIIGGQNNTIQYASGKGISSINRPYNSAIIGGNNNIVYGCRGLILNGEHAEAINGEVVMGAYNVSNATSSPTAQKLGLFIIGNGTGSTRSNAFRVDSSGYVYGGQTFAAKSADYAEFFEWEDGNPNNEDRRGLFVVFAEPSTSDNTDDLKIRIATENDVDILGVVSAAPALVGDTQSETWKDMFLKDVFGNLMKDENGERIVNPEYDPTREYVSREFRPEWSPVGLLGKLVVIDDGTCKKGGFCKVSNGGIATDAESGYRVLSRIDDTHVKIFVK